MLVALFFSSDGVAQAEGTVTNCTETNLRAAMAGGGTVTFACDGTITLSGTISNSLATVLDATGHQITISGGNSVRVFLVPLNSTLTLKNLTISGGRSPDGTNGMYDGINATPGGPGAPGGGLCNLGSLELQTCTVAANRSGKGGNGSGINTYGGANSAGGDGGSGGGIFNAGSLSLSNCVVTGNTTGNGGAGGGSLTYYPAGGSGGRGGGICNAGTLTMQNSTVQYNGTGLGVDNPLRGPGSSGGDGAGVWSSGSFASSGCTFFANTNGAGGKGGASDMVGGPGARGGSGGGIYTEGNAALTNCTVAGNVTGAGGAGGIGYGLPPMGHNGSTGANGSGAGLCASSNLEMVNGTVAANQVGGGIANLGGPALLLNSIVAGNIGTPGDVSGTFVSLGHNLIGTTNGSSGFSVPNDLVGSNPLLLDPQCGPLAPNGGPTLTMALLPGSPAIDAGSSAGAPATDQRGVARPQGSGVDIGAFEYQFPVFTQFNYQNATNCRMQIAGLLPNLTYTLEASSNLVNWSTVTGFVAGTNGMCQITDATLSHWPTHFYRLKSGAP